MTNGDNHDTQPPSWSGQWDVHFKRGFKAGLLAAAEIFQVQALEMQLNATITKHLDALIAAQAAQESSDADT